MGSLESLPPEIYRLIARNDRSIYLKLACLNQTMRKNIAVASAQELISPRELINATEDDDLTDDGVIHVIESVPTPIIYKTSGDMFEFRMDASDVELVLDFLLSMGCDVGLTDRHAIYRRRESCVNLNEDYPIIMTMRTFQRRFNLLLRMIKERIGEETERIKEGTKEGTKERTKEGTKAESLLDLVIDMVKLLGEFGDLVEGDLGDYYYSEIKDSLRAKDYTMAVEIMKREADRLIAHVSQLNE